MTEHATNHSGELNSEQAQRLAELSRQATEIFGNEATFAYVSRKDGLPYTLTLSGAIAICGEFIAELSTEQALRTLQKMQVVAPVESAQPETKRIFSDSVERGQALLARRALSEEG